MKTLKSLVLPVSYLFAIAVSIFVFALPVFAYEEDTHFQMTYVICRSVGFTHGEALIVAAVDQGMDDSPGTVANGGIGSLIPNVPEEWKWHALDLNGEMGASGVLARKKKLFQDALDETTARNKLIRLGVFFHFQQDTWAHRHHYESNHLSPVNYTTYNTPFGHAYDFNQPDRPPFDPVAALMNLEDGIDNARRFLKQGLGREPGGFLADYTPQEGSEDSGWSKDGKYFHQISLAGAAPNSARSYLLNLIRAQIDQYTSSKDPLFFGNQTAKQADLNKMRAALENVCKDFERFRGAGIPDPAITIPTSEVKDSMGFYVLTSAALETRPFPKISSKGLYIAASAYSDGRIDLFYLGNDTRIYHNLQKADNSWIGEAPLGTGSAQQICSAVNKDDRMEIFYFDYNNWIFHNSQTAPASRSWNGEAPLKAQGKHIVCGKNSDGRLEIFYVGMDDRILHNWQENNSYGGWHGQSADLNGEAKAKVMAVTSNKAGGIELFYAGLNNHLFRNWQTTGGWSGEIELEGEAKQISVVADKDGLMNIFYVGMNNLIYSNRQNAAGGWAGEVLWFAGIKAKHIVSTLDKDGRIQVFYIGGDDSLYTCPDAQRVFYIRDGDSIYIGPGSSKINRLEASAKQIIAVNRNNGRLELFYVGGVDDGIYVKSQIWPDKGWSDSIPVYRSNLDQ